ITTEVTAQCLGNLPGGPGSHPLIDPPSRMLHVRQTLLSGYLNPRNSIGSRAGESHRLRALRPARRTAADPSTNTRPATSKSFAFVHESVDDSVRGFYDFAY